MKLIYKCTFSVQTCTPSTALSCIESPPTQIYMAVHFSMLWKRWTVLKITAVKKICLLQKILNSAPILEIFMNFCLTRLKMKKPYLHMPPIYHSKYITNKNCHKTLQNRCGKMQYKLTVLANLLDLGSKQASRARRWYTTKGYFAWYKPQCHQEGAVVHRNQLIHSSFSKP